MDLCRQADFPENTNFPIVDKLIHGNVSKECRRKLMAKGNDVPLKDCWELMKRFEAVEDTMKKLEDHSDAHVNASYTRDPTQKSQRNGSKKKQFKPKRPQDNKRPEDKKSCVWCKGDIHPRDKCPAKDATCTFYSKQGHFERACLEKKGQDKEKKSKHQHVVTAVTMRTNLT